jgi:hypothetical protein
MTIVLYHFTSVANLPAIVQSGKLLMSESHISPKRRMAGPAVVWLTKSDDPAKCGVVHDKALQQLHDFDLVDKTRIRFTVELPPVMVTKYLDWARARGIDRRWLAHVMASGAARGWYVSTRPIGMLCWRQVYDRLTDRVVWMAPPHTLLRSAADLNEVP